MAPVTRPKIRLFVEQPLGPGQAVSLSREQAHYLFGVMRLKPGAEVALFDGQSGEWAALVVEADRRSGRLDCVAQSAPQQDPQDLWLLFAPVKKARTDFIVEKAVEMGVARLCPVATAFTNSERIREDRMQSNVIEAAEQCGATHLPQIAPLVRLEALLSDWPSERHLLYCDETTAGQGAALRSSPAPAAILVGPEGGFSPEELSHLRAADFASPMTLGPRILRAETAVVAALALWQSQNGDWQ